MYGDDQLDGLLRANALSDSVQNMCEAKIEFHKLSLRTEFLPVLKDLFLPVLKDL